MNDYIAYRQTILEPCADVYTDNIQSGYDAYDAYQGCQSWYEYQKEFVNQLDLSPYEKEAMYRDKACLSEVILYQKKQILRETAAIALYGDRVVIDEESDEQLVFPFAEVTAVTVLGRNKLNIYHNKNVYQFKGDKRFNALKYVNMYYRWKNINTEDENVKFLGL